MISPAAVYLDLRLYPHRSLTRGQLRLLITVIALVCGLGALRVLWLGAWPVAIFLLLDVVLVILAFHFNNRAARGYERLVLSREQLHVRQIDPRGNERLRSFNPHWVSVGLRWLNADENRLELRSHGRSLAIGQFLSPEERSDIAKVLEDGLRRARAGCR